MFHVKRGGQFLYSGVAFEKQRGQPTLYPDVYTRTLMLVAGPQLPRGGKHGFKGVRGRQGKGKDKYQGVTPRKQHRTAGRGHVVHETDQSQVIFRTETRKTGLRALIYTRSGANVCMGSILLARHEQRHLGGAILGAHTVRSQASL